jgi:hypothetical protein
MSDKLNSAIAVIGIDIGKNSFHIVGHDQRGAIVLWQKWSRGQVVALCNSGRPDRSRRASRPIAAWPVLHDERTFICARLSRKT